LNTRIRFFKTSLFLSLLLCGFNLSADVIDSYSAAQGPFTVGPDERISDEDAVVFTASVLGGFRFASPGVDDDATAGSTATLDISGGSFTCSVDYPDVSTLNNGGCISGYDHDEGPAFNLSGSTGLELDVQSVTGKMSLSISLLDIDRGLSVGYIENVTQGQLSIAFSALFPATLPNGADLSRIDNIALAITNQVEEEGSVTLGEFSTDGPITEGPTGPPSNGGDIGAREISGNYFNPSRDGEGCQLTLERDGVTFILTCYFYSDGDQFWLIGVGQLHDGQIIFADMTITTGADYGNDFDANDVIRTSWGSIIMTWGDCNNAELELMPSLPGFEELTLVMTRLIPVTCGGDGPQGDSLPWMGAYFEPSRDGEGFQLALEGDGSIYVLTWYTYQNGEQIWLIGVGSRNGNRLTFDNMIITSGADFGSDFDANDVQRETFGEIILDFNDCNNLVASVNPVLPEFHALVLGVTKIVPGVCP
jgi:hypothetical protein